MKIELKNMEYSERLSEETCAFSADLYVNGKKAGVAKNEGKGGITSYSPIGPDCVDLIKQAEEWCRKEHPPSEPANLLHMEIALIDYIDGLVEDFLQRDYLKSMEDSMKRHVVVSSDPGNSFHGYPLRYAMESILASDAGRNYLVRRIADIKRQLGENEKILNTNIPEQIFRDAGLEAHQFVKPRSGGGAENNESRKPGKKPRNRGRHP